MQPAAEAVSRATPLSLDAGDVTKIGVGIIIALVLIGFLLTIVITAIVGRIITALVVVALAIFVWTQRNSVKDEIGRHSCNITFFGVHLDPPDDIKAKYCSSRR